MLAYKYWCVKKLLHRRDPLLNTKVDEASQTRIHLENDQEVSALLSQGDFTIPLLSLTEAVTSGGNDSSQSLRMDQQAVWLTEHIGTPVHELVGNNHTFKGIHHHSNKVNMQNSLSDNILCITIVSLVMLMAVLLLLLAYGVLQQEPSAL